MINDNCFYGTNTGIYIDKNKYLDKCGEGWVVQLLYKLEDLGLIHIDPIYRWVTEGMGF